MAQVASDQYIAGFRLASPRPLQAEVLRSESESALSSGPFDRTSATQTGKLISDSSIGSQAIEFPHSAKIEGRVGTASDVTAPLVMCLDGTSFINIPADGQSHVAVGGCTIDADQHLVAMIPLMRTRGTHQTVRTLAVMDTTAILEAAFDPLHVNYTVLASDAHLPVDIKLGIDCTFVNNGRSMLHFGGTSASETCFTGFYHYAHDGASSDRYRCANSQSPDFMNADRAVLARVRGRGLLARENGCSESVRLGGAISIAVVKGKSGHEPNSTRIACSAPSPIHGAKMKPLRSASSHRGATRSAIAILGIALTIAACSGGDSTSPPPGGGRPDVWEAVASSAWAIPALTESYRCYGAQVSAEEYITGFRLAAPSAAQTELLLFVLDAPPTLGSFDCASSTASGHLIYAAGIGTTPIEFRTGQGVHIAAGKYLLLNVHIVNASDVNLTDSTRIERRVGTASDVTTPLEMALVGKLSFTIPTGDAPLLINAGCDVLADQHFVALVPIMRSLGVHQAVNLTAPGDTVQHVLHDASFSPTHVLYDSFTSDIYAPAGSQLSTSCTFVNTTGHPVTFGESAQNEYCFSGIYRYPVATGTYDFLACARGAGLDFRRPES